MSPFSIQLYSARKFPPPQAQLAAVAACGFTGVETFGPWHDDLAATARALAAHGLAAPSAHIPFEILTRETAQALDIAGALGALYAVAPFVPASARPADVDGWRRLGETLEAVGQVYARHGVALAWHNHDFEFRPLPDGSRPLEHLLGASLLWEADLAWVARGGEDPAQWLQRYSGRVPVLHVKDLAPAGENAAEDGWADVGAGILPWPELWRLARAAGTRLFVAEHDNPSDFNRFARVSLAAMQSFDRGAA